MDVSTGTTNLSVLSIVIMCTTLGIVFFLKIMYMQKGRNSVWYFNVNSLLYYMSI